MTNKEAIEKFEKIKRGIIFLIHQRVEGKEVIEDYSLCDMAISALQEQDSKARKTCKTCKYGPPSKKWPCVDCDMTDKDRWELNADEIREALATVPSAQPETCEDAVSREAAIKCCAFGRTSLGLINELRRLPSVTPKPRTGKWLINSDGYYPYCSECKAEPKSGEMTDFCPNCGAKMEGKE